VTPLWFRRVIREGDSGSDVDTVRRRLGLGPGDFDQVSAAVVRGVARLHDVPSGGEVTAEVAAVVGESEANQAGLLPAWFVDHNDDALRVRLGVGGRDDLVAAVKRWQGNHGFPPTAVLSPVQALMIGE